MLRSRVIPCLLIQNKGLVKTVQFKDPKYVGDPVNAVRIFNEKLVDELMVLDIDATIQAREPDYKMIENVAAECRMPLCYGGGVKSVEQVLRILSLGVEKVALSSALIESSNLVKEISDQIGTQSIVAVLDVKKSRFGSRYDIYTQSAKKKESIELLPFIQQLQESGIGELVLNSIDRDGTMKGYDLNLIEKVKAKINIPMTVMGGASCIEDIEKLIEAHHPIGVAAGSVFVFKGKYRAVLINYPKVKNYEQQDAVLENSF